MTLPSAFRVYAPDHPLLAVTVRALLQEQHKRVAYEIAAGLAADWGAYRERVGILKGLDLAMVLCDKAEKELDAH